MKSPNWQMASDRSGNLVVHDRCGLSIKVQVQSADYHIGATIGRE